jgi:hypothetical protein
MTSHPTAEDLEIFEAVREKPKKSPSDSRRSSKERALWQYSLLAGQAEIVGVDLQVRKRRSYNHPG